VKKKGGRFLTYLFVATLGAVCFLRSSFFNIKDIEIVSKNSSTQEMIQTQLKNIYGQNLWEIDLELISEQLLSKNKILRSLRFQKKWPQRLILNLEEREGLALIFVGQQLWQVDKEGIAFSKIPQSLPFFWPIPLDKKKYLSVLDWLSVESPQEVNGLTWDRELGLVVMVELGNMKNSKIILGTQNFLENWKKAKLSLEFLSSRGIRAKKIDATYNKRAVVSL
jgi:hypothetical protein